MGILALQFHAALLELVAPFEIVESHDHADHRHKGEAAQEQRLPLEAQEKTGTERRVHLLKNSNSLGVGESREFHPAYFAINGQDFRLEGSKPPHIVDISAKITIHVV